MRSFNIRFATLILLIGAATPGNAQQATSGPPANGAAALASQPPDTIRLTEILGARVDLMDGTPAGVVTDVFLAKTGAVASVAIGVAGARGLGDKNIAVPEGRLSFSSAGQERVAFSPGAIAQPHKITFKTNLTDKDIQSAPDFAPQQQPSTAGTQESAPEPKSSTQSGGPG